MALIPPSEQDENLVKSDGQAIKMKAIATRSIRFSLRNISSTAESV
jgi:hypothetical protein